MQKITYKKKADSEAKVKKILHPLVAKWFFSRFKSFSEPQKTAVLEIHSRKNILVSAPTGATKTLTSFLAILNELVDSAKKGILEDRVHAIYVSPLKALNNDIKANLLEPLEEINKLNGKDLGIRIAVRTGDTTPKEKAAMLKNPPHILITTPESLGIILSSPKFRDHLKNVEWFIADEIHALADNKRGVHLSISLERLKHLSQHITRIGLSATVAPLEEIAKYLVGTEDDCIIVDITFKKEMDLKVISPVPDLINTSHENIHNKLYEKVHKLIQKHDTTLIFTNTRAATERVVDYLKEKYPKHYNDNNIGAHHGSLSAEHRTTLESNLKKGKLKAVACSTSLELGIDIGSIDLVITLGSPKSVARALQRIGRSGHSLNSVTKGRIIVLNRDDLVECAVLLKAAVERKIDRVQVPTNALDVLAQHIYGMAIEEVWEETELYNTIKKSYCYRDLSITDFNEILAYLAGEFASLEDRYVYAKIWRKEGKIGRRGKLARVIYMTNIGTIPDQSGVAVKIGTQTVGTIDESFLERLRPGDVFVLGGNRYIFKYTRGMTAQVSVSVDRPPTVPRWASESLPLSYDLAIEIGKFRDLMKGKFEAKKSKTEIIKLINDYLYVSKSAANAIYSYFYEQYNYLNIIPTHREILIEHYNDESGRKIVFHTLYGRRVNDVLSRAIGFAITKSQKKEVEIGINDNGFYLGIKKSVNVMKALKLIKSKELRKLMDNAIDNSEVLKRRFRHCAGRSLMILRNYLGRKKQAGRQQMSSMFLLAAVKRISENFPILKEARREVLEDLMDLKNTEAVMEGIEKQNIKIKEVTTTIPSPFAFNIVMQGIMDIIKMEDRQDFLKRMHQLVIAKIALNKGKKKEKIEEDDLEEFDYEKEWDNEEIKQREDLEEFQYNLKMQLLDIEEPKYVKDEILKLIDNDKRIRSDTLEYLQKDKLSTYPKELKDFIKKQIENL